MNRSIRLPRARLAAAVLASLTCFAVQAAEQINASHAAKPDAEVAVSNIRGRVEVRGADRNEVRVTGSVGKGSKFSLTGTDDRIVIKVENERDDWSWWGGNGPQEDTVLVVEVPRAAAIDVDTVSADIEVEGIAGAREMELESVSGDQRVRGDAERVEVSSVSGDVDVESASRSIGLETVSGDLVARGASGRVTAESVSGRVTLETGDIDELSASSVSGDINLRTGNIAAGRVKIESMSGEVEVLVPPSLSARIEAESFSGKIRSDFGTVEEEEHGPGSHLKATAGAGAAQITLESFSGDVTIRRQ